MRMNVCAYMCFDAIYIGWFVCFTGISTLFELFKAKLNFKQFSLS